MMVKLGVRRALMTSAVIGLLLSAAAVPPAVAASATRDAQPVTKPCPGSDQYYPDSDPSKFWECSNGIAYRFDCPAGLHWDTNLLTCNYPEQAGRQADPTQTRSTQRSVASDSTGTQTLETKHIQGQVITHTIIKPLRAE
ncbi:carbohydrate-binding module family 14 protein [Kitasatospora sp. NPDC057223]|uniref:carbohydrate-binding module family 14 protein n=1 Tax=Kitasatospora sp. NPDC057223 TaxID=3346055 RepID=UPI003641C7AA